ncbi:serine/threonine-protein kinase [Nannocystis sp. SCPEA4]|uniref:serine/threonine-protein kinase n=1 Tax=Nannocystis sp. SCPEA4 TaxID=2996787 RepID=UPI0022714AF7|nr:serine/threonine-protein kinase [Nannocystis sp. SCPEA4]MCY1054516.1 protein kinase [Nannocystis sp. SCPEA4]
MSGTKRWPWDKPGEEEPLVMAELRPSVTGSEPQIVRYLRDIEVEPQVSPGLDELGPPIDGHGDGRYAVGDQLGRGGGGVVYLGADRSMRRTVAVKVLSPDHANDPVRVQAFVEEAIITGGLEHPNIVPAYDLGCSPTLGLYYTMKRLTGRPLSEIIEALYEGDPATSHSFGMYRLLGCFIELCRAVAYAHARGVLHCDLKPENVLIGEYGEVVLVDWGLAQVLGPEGRLQARAHMHAGTPEYMAPEQITKAGHDLDVRSDIWSLGVILYEILTLTQPFQGANAKEVLMRVMVEQVEPPSRRAPNRPIPPGVEDICRRALSKNREHRYGSVVELLADLDAYLEGSRERMRRSELARRSLDAAHLLLDRLRPLEEECDYWLAGRPSDEGEVVRTAFMDEPRLADLRRELMAVYREAAQLILRGLESDSEVDSLGDAGGDVYWRVFMRIYPSSTPTSGPTREAAMDLLLTLSQKCFSGIVRAGRRLTRSRELSPITTSDLQRPGPTTIDDPWLNVVSTLCGDQEEEIDETRAPHSLRTLIGRIMFLRRISLFNAVPTAALLPIAEACHEVAFAPLQPVFEQGAPGDALCILLEGTVEVVRDGAVINRLKPGDVCGEVAVLSQSARTAGVFATEEPVRALMLGADRFRKIVRESGDIGLAVIEVLSERLRVATEREAALRSLAKTILAKKVDLALP